jgi:hypothetical protein
MSQWFKNTRQEFIFATLKQFGQIRRADLVRQFDISIPQASTDIGDFLAANPAFAEYDPRLKTYVIREDVP